MNNFNLYESDLNKTQKNHMRLNKHANLLYWYEKLYRELIFVITDIDNKNILEVGSGASPLKLFLPGIVTSDILELSYLDIIFDCHEIDALGAIPDHSLDIITCTNVLHHLQDPILFLCNATKKLKKGGLVLIVEPYFSKLSHLIYRYLHHEDANFSISSPHLRGKGGPLSFSNQAIPHMIFFSRPDWLDLLCDCYDLKNIQYGFFSSISYMLTGGISRILPIPQSLYRILFLIDIFLAKKFPKIFASFTVRLITKN